ncbi:MAG: hypothetical protein AUK47_23950 [Deltaproteobacteria bacterium CG2_30_63_29]|nr:MAG: hypothetical protein AUK47_23950 [Deltaproteobacteria bacterium CG2_30_63_29]PJB35900.1 MAG: hypothetical protein CO108_24535 [Deltaproteobacteria bacterium CG_4_9_14_3_um_filter_63_12]
MSFSNTLSSDAAHRRTKVAGVLLLVVLTLFVPGCKLIFEPADDAADRLFEALVTRDFRTMEELLKDDELRGKARRLSGIFNSPPFKGKAGYWNIELVEEDEPTGFTYVYVTFEIPIASKSVRGSKHKDVEVILEMKREWLRWTVTNIDYLDDLIKQVERSR